MVYRVDLSPAAQRELRGIDSGARDRILRALAKLENEPRPAGAKKLKGRDELWPFGSAIIGSFTRFANRFSLCWSSGSLTAARCTDEQALFRAFSSALMAYVNLKLRHPNLALPSDSPRLILRA